MTKNKVATTIKIPPDLYDYFKVLGIRHRLHLQGLIERTVFRYVYDEKYREEMNNFAIPHTTEPLPPFDAPSVVPPDTAKSILTPVPTSQ